MGVGFYELDNGMDLIVHRDPDANEFHFLFGAKMGSEKEGVRRIESVHLLEHLFFRSTALPETLQMMEDWGRHRMRTQGETNTGYVYGFFYGPTQHMRYIIEQGYRAISNTAYDIQEFEKEKRILRIERRGMKGDMDLRMNDCMTAHLYPGTRYAVSLDEIIGNIDLLTPTKVLRLKESIFRPHNMTLVAIGNKDAGEVAEIVNATFGRMPKTRPIAPYRIALQPPAPFTIEFDDRGIDAHHVRHVYRAGEVQGTYSKDRLAELYLLHAILGAGNTYDDALLYKNLRVMTGRTYVPQTSISEGSPELLLEIDYDCEMQDIEPNGREVDRILGYLAEHRIPSEQLTTYARFAINEFNSDHTDDEEKLAGWYLVNSANGLMMSPKEFKDTIRAVTPERLQSLAGEIAPNKGTIIFHPMPGPITVPRAQPAFGNSSSLPAVVVDGTPGSSTSSSPDSTILKET